MRLFALYLIFSFDYSHFRMKQATHNDSKKTIPFLHAENLIEYPLQVQRVTF